MSRERLHELIETLALERGKKFKLSSGGFSTIYIDGKKVTLDGEGNYLVAEQMLEIIATNFPTARAVGGLAMGANFIVPSIVVLSDEKGYPFTDGFIVYKEEGEIRVANPPLPGIDVVVVDDTTSTGHSLQVARDAVPECNVIGGVVMVDRSLGLAEQMLGFPVVSLFTIDDFQR